MKVILHIGVEKTGTTSIQNILATNSAMLRFHNTIYYGGRLLPNKNQSAELVLASVEQPGGNFARLRGANILDFREQVKAEIRSVIKFAENNGVTQILFSSEHMSSRMRLIDEIKILKSLFPVNTSFKIVVYCRRQDELYLGTLAEGIKAGVVIKEPLDTEIKLDDGFYSRNYYDYFQLISMWSNVFGKNNVQVFTFEQSQLKSANVVPDFLSRVLQIDDLSAWRIPENHQLNRRLSAEFLYFLSHFNKTCSNSDRVTILKNTATVDIFTSNSFIPVSRLEEFLASFRRSNDLVARNFQNREQLFFQNGISEEDYVVADKESLLISMRSINGMLAGILS